MFDFQKFPNILKHKRNSEIHLRIEFKNSWKKIVLPRFRSRIFISLLDNNCRCWKRKREQIETSEEQNFLSEISAVCSPSEFAFSLVIHLQREANSSFFLERFAQLFIFLWMQRDTLRVRSKIFFGRGSGNRRADTRTIRT